MANNKYSNLKGIKLYNALLKELGEANKKATNSQRLSSSQRRKIVSEQLYPKFKDAPRVLVGQVNKDIRRIIKGLPPIEICNPLYLSEAYLSFVEYYEINNHIMRVLPECLDVRVNGGQYGVTKIFNTSNYSYYSDGVQKIIENIRKEIDNSSGRAYFSGIVKLKPRRKNNGEAQNYFVDYVLYMNDEPLSSDDGVDYSLPKREGKKVEKVKDFLVEKFKILEKEKKKRKRQAKKKREEAKKQDPKEQKRITNQAIQNAIASLRLLLKNRIITKEEFERQKRDLISRKK
jgi:hypothetical protein